jgi:oligosaccharyltransferase complex subunit beta
MLDPHLRVPLPLVSSTDNTSTYSTTVKLPDRHGVFTLLVDNRDVPSGYTPIEERTTISITPPRHDEYPRFISGAWPFYVGAGGTAAIWLVFVVLWLAGGGGKRRKKTE